MRSMDASPVAPAGADQADALAPVVPTSIAAGSLAVGTLAATAKLAMLRPVGRAVGRSLRRLFGAQVSTVEAAGLMHGVASIGPSFDKSLLPRTTVQQAGVTGVVSVLNYGLTTTTQAILEAFAERVAGEQRLDRNSARRAVLLTADLAGLGTGLLLQRTLRQRTGESIWRAGARTAAGRLWLGSAAGALAVAADSVVDVVTHKHDARNVNAMLTVAVGAGVAAGIHLAGSRRLLDTAAETDQYGEPVRPASYVQPVRAVIVGSGVSVGLFTLSRVESWVAHGIGTVVGYALPSWRPASRAIGHAVTLTGMAVGLERALSYAQSMTETAGNAVEPAYRNRPDSPYVSGGPNSQVDWDTIGREGRRFVNMALTTDEITAVTGEDAVDPIRVFVGIESAESPNSRAYLAMAELERMGAFQRPTIVVYSPTGSGYVNYVAVETMEFLSRGNTAGVCIQYSVRPSFLSLDQVGTAWESMLALLTALAWRIRSMPEGQRPRVLLFGESLGSQSAQDVFEKEGVRGFEILDINHALFIGSPYASKWRRNWLADPQHVDPNGVVVEVDSPAEYEALPAERRAQARVVLLTHHNDPVPKFGPTLALQRPYWLGAPETRPSGIARDMRYWPLFTFLLVGVDLLNADNVVPGKFEAWAHDYRKNLPQMVRRVFGLDIDDATMERVEKALRERERSWAERRLVSETLDKAEQSVRAKLDEWGVDHTVVPSLVTAKRDVAPDPFAVPGAAAP